MAGLFREWKMGSVPAVPLADGWEDGEDGQRQWKCECGAKDHGNVYGHTLSYTNRTTTVGGGSTLIYKAQHNSMLCTL